MTIAQFWNSGWTAALFNHLWQSTCVVLVAWLLSRALRSNPARVRYAIWMLASVKFLVPFALLANLGSRWAKPVAGRAIGSVLYTAVDEISRPFQQTQPALAPAVVSSHPAHVFAWVPFVLVAAWLCGILLALGVWVVRWRRIVRIADSALPVYEGREAEALRRAEHHAGLRKPIPLRVTSLAIEPGIFGIFRPVLLWPAGISDQLSDAQIEAIAAHEVEHVRRRDNLAAAVHMVVEALFWFHPAVRWIGSRLVEERERACDEKVVEQNARPEAYAESILKVCAYCLEPPAPCVSGVSGSDLKERILRIMTHRSGVRLNSARKLMLGCAAVLAIAAPMGFGVVHAMQAPAKTDSPTPDVYPDVPKYDVATIKPAPAESEGRVMMMMTPDGVSISGVPMQMLLREAFRTEDDRLVGVPDWAKKKRYDIQAKVSPEEAPKLEKLKIDERRSMILPLLIERFNLRYHHEMRELPGYVLVLAKGGPKMKAVEVQDTDLPPRPPDTGDPKTDNAGVKNPPKRMMRLMGPGHVEAEGSDMQGLARVMSLQLGRTVVDQTGLTGNYDYTLKWTPDNAPPPMPGGGPEGGPPRNDNAGDAAGPSVFTAVQEQLGLKLEPTKGLVDVIVIDHIDPPSEN
jgi:bla regulator protein blaR1